MHFFAKDFCFYACVAGWIRFEPAQRSLEQRGGAQSVVPLEMMERCRDLNEALQEGLLGFLTLKPDDLPVLVCLKEIFAAITEKSFGKFSATPVECHRLYLPCGARRKTRWPRMPQTLVLA